MAVAPGGREYDDDPWGEGEPTVLLAVGLLTRSARTQALAQLGYEEVHPDGQWTWSEGIRELDVVPLLGTAPVRPLSSAGRTGFVHFKRQRLSVGSGVSWRSMVA